MRRLLIMLAMTAVILGCAMAANYLLDPYGAWGTGLIDPAFRDVAADHLVVPYLLRTARPEVVLVGSSRVVTGMRIEQGARGSFLNAGIKGCSIPELVKVVDLALSNPRLRKIVWGLDFFQFDEHWFRDDKNLDARVAGIRLARFEDTLLSLSALDDGVKMLRASWDGARHQPLTMSARVPWPMDLICSEFTQQRGRGLVAETSFSLHQQVRDSMPDYSKFRVSARDLEMFREVVERARRRGVEVIPIVSPMSDYEMQLLWQGGCWAQFQQWKRQLADIAPFWDFSGFTPMSRTDLLFWDAMHYKPSVGHLMLRMVLGMPAQPCDLSSALVANSAVRVDKSNLEQALAARDSMRESCLREGDEPYARFVSEIIRSRATEPPAQASRESAEAGPQ